MFKFRFYNPYFFKNATKILRPSVSLLRSRIQPVTLLLAAGIPLQTQQSPTTTISNTDFLKLFDGKIHNEEEKRQIYRKLCVGSLFGTTLGFIFGKLSNLFMLIGLTVFISLDFLAKKGIIELKSIKNLYNQLGIKKESVINWVLTDTWFKVPFLATLLLAALNS